MEAAIACDRTRSASTRSASRASAIGPMFPLGFVRELTGVAARPYAGCRHHLSPRSQQGMAQKSAKSSIAIHETTAGFTAEERAAMKERAKEPKAEARANKDKAEG